MGVFTDYFVARREDITEELVTDGPDGHVVAADLLRAKGADLPVMLGQLGEQLTGVSFLEIGEGAKHWSSHDGAVPSDPAEMAAFFEEQGPGASVDELQDALRDAIAGIPPDDLLSVARKWATIDELAGTTAEEIAPFLEGLVALARRAVASDRHLYCWWSL